MMHRAEEDACRKVESNHWEHEQDFHRHKEEHHLLCPRKIALLGPILHDHPLNSSGHGQCKVDRPIHHDAHGVLEQPNESSLLVFHRPGEGGH